MSSDPVLQLEALSAGYDAAAVVRDARPPRRLRRGGRPARPQRCRQDDHAASDLRSRPPDVGHDSHRRRRHRQAVACRASAPRHRPRARGSGRVLRPDRRRALPSRIPGRAPRRRGRLRVLPGARRARRPSGRAAVRRRAADARARASTGPPPAAVAARRAVARARAGHRRAPAPGRHRRTPRRAAAPCCWSSSTSTSRSPWPSRGYVLSHGELVIHEAAEALRADHRLILSGYLGEQETTASDA